MKAMNASKRRPKALVLLSGGLDSLLATRIMLDQDVDVEAVHFVTPFSKYDHNLINKIARDFSIKVHVIFLGQDFLDIVVKPKYGYGGQMNPCIDCRILMLRRAKELAEKISADFIVTGEVLNERPFSQRLKAMQLIEQEAGLKGKILRPLSAKLLPPTEAELRGWVNRERLLAIKGKRRIPQMELAARYGIKDYPTPAGGCLLTDPAFAKRLREHLMYEGRLTLIDTALLTVGRHFRINGVKVIVGRNRDENDKLLAIAENNYMPYLVVKDYKGPITVVTRETDTTVMEKAAAITARYSDAPRNIQVKVLYRRKDREEEITVVPLSDEEIAKYRI